MLLNPLCISLLLSIILFLAPVISNADESSMRYRTPAERRDAGQTHQITHWLHISPLIELEYGSQSFRTSDPDINTSNTHSHSKTLQLEIEIIPADGLKADIVYEYDELLDEFILEEAIAEFEYDDFKLELGKFDLPFGEYYSRFVSGPLVEFGETRGRGLVLAYEPGDQFETAVFIFKSKMERDVFADDKLDWGFAISTSLGDSVSTGVSYISDLAEASEPLLESHFNYQQRVDAVTAYLLFEHEHFDTSIEWLQALDAFAELDADRNQPRAWNVEIAVYPDTHFELALRVEGSKELEDAPELQAGIAGSYRAGKYVTATVEFLQGRFKQGFAEDAQGNEVEKQNQLNLQLVISF